MRKIPWMFLCYGDCNKEWMMKIVAAFVLKIIKMMHGNENKKTFSCSIEFA